MDVERSALNSGDALAQTDLLVTIWGSDRMGSTVERLGGLARQFATGLAGRGLRLQDAEIDDVERYVFAITRRGAVPSAGTQRQRRTAVADIYRAARTIDPLFPDPTTGIDLASKPPAGTRPVTGNELHLIRTAALGRTRNALRAAAVVALCEATATTGELLRVSWADTDLDTGQVQLPGATPIKARIGTLTSWGVGVLRHWHAHSTGVGPVIPSRSARRAHHGQAGMVSLLSQLISQAGLARSGLRPASIRLWAAQTELKQHGIEAAARALGVRSLDTAADALGYRWSQ